jgi:hypothetical protein
MSRTEAATAVCILAVLAGDPEILSQIPLLNRHMRAIKFIYGKNTGAFEPQCGAVRLVKV